MTSHASFHSNQTGAKLRISVIGGTGFVGHAVVARLLNDGHQIRLLVRSNSQHKAFTHPRCTWIAGELNNPASLQACLDDSDVVIYLVGLLRERPAAGITFDALHYQGVKNTIAAAQATGVKRFLLMSANGIDAAMTPYQITKLQAEQALKDSGLEFTIFRPSVIFGDPHGQGRMEICTQLKAELIDSPLPAPLFYSGLLPTNAGLFELGPVWVDDVAAAFAIASTRTDTIGQTYELCGPARMTWKQLLTLIAQAAGKSKLMIPAPAAVIQSVAAVFDRFAWFPVTRDQLRMLLAGNVCGDNGFQRLGITPTPLTARGLSYLRH